MKSRPGKYCTQLSRLHASEGCDDPQIRHSLVIQVSVGSTVDGSEIRRSPVELGSSPHYLQDLIHPWWYRISSINSITTTSLQGYFQTDSNKSPSWNPKRRRKMISTIHWWHFYLQSINKNKKNWMHMEIKACTVVQVHKKVHESKQSIKIINEPDRHEKTSGSTIHLWNISKRQHTSNIMGNIPIGHFFGHPDS